MADKSIINVTLEATNGTYQTFSDPIGLIEKDKGTVYIKGQDITTRSTETRMICGYMPQEINLDDELKIIYEDLWKKKNEINTSIKLPLNIKINNQNLRKNRHFAQI